MLQLAAVMSVTSAIALLFGFIHFAMATAMVSVALLCLIPISMLLVIGYTLAGRASYWFPPTG